MEGKKKLREMTQEEKREYWNMRYWKERPTRLMKWKQKSLERTQEEKDRMRDYQKLWRQRNRDYVASKRRERYERDVEYERRRRRERYLVHREDILKKQKELRRLRKMEREMNEKSPEPQQPQPLSPLPLPPPPPPPPPPPVPQVYETSLKELIEDLFPSLIDVFFAHNEVHNYLHE